MLACFSLAFEIGLFVLVAGASAGVDSLGPREILLLMEASRARYENLEATLQERTYERGEDGEPVLVGQSTAVYRRTPRHMYTNVHHRSVPDDRVDMTRQYAIGSRDARELVTHHKTGKTTGMIVRPRKLIPTMHSPYEAMWDVLDRPWSRLVERIDTAEVRVEEGLVILEMVTVDYGSMSMRLRLTVDPAKDFVPVKTELLRSDQSEPWTLEVCEDWRRINGLWVPFKYTSSAPTAGYWQEFVVQSMTLNEPVPPEKLTVRFPEGIVIDDAIRGLRYKSGSPSREAMSLQEDMSKTSVLPPAASDLQLGEAAAKAQALKTEAGVLEDALPVLQVQPSYVWVTRGTRDYVLRVSGLDAGQAAAEPPGLSSHTFSPDGLVLHGLEDRIAETGTIRVTVERPSEQQTFTDAVLTLELGGQTVAVHFVAAPLTP